MLLNVQQITETEMAWFMFVCNEAECLMWWTHQHSLCNLCVDLSDLYQAKHGDHIM